VFTPVGASEIIPVPTVLSGLFDLSPSEARLAVTLAAGTPLKIAAAANDIKFSTARAYLEQIFRKTGTNKQPQLVALLKSANVIRSRAS
jgi:DNA-binding CsgD family transcriptional regulator